MSIKDIPHVTTEQVIRLREAAIQLENTMAEAQARIKVLEDALCNTWNEIWNAAEVSDLSKPHMKYIYKAEKHISTALSTTLNTEAIG